MSQKLVEKLYKALEGKLEEVKQEVSSVVAKLKEDFEETIQDIIDEVTQEDKDENSFVIDLDTFSYIISKGRVTKLEGVVEHIYKSPDSLYLNDRSVIRPPFDTFEPTNVFEIEEIELTLPSGKVLNTKEVKELFVSE